jgi:dGTPase
VDLYNQDSDWKRVQKLRKKQDIITKAVFKNEEYRPDWRRDYCRVLHSSSFRRLQGKTQLFPGNESDFFRNRLTHSLEVCQIAKSIAVRLNNTDKYLKANQFEIIPDICELAGLAHDLGHPPFGHQGESALNALMQ